MAQRGVIQLSRKLLADRIARLRLGNRRRGGPQSGVIEAHGCRDQRIVDDFVADNLARCRATDYGRSFEVSSKLTYEVTFLYQWSSAKGENNT
jgi:hypothetical protein